MTDPLAFARSLIAQGVPVFVAPPDAAHPVGFRLPTGWQASKATPRALDDWQPGWAVCALGGHGIDVIDVDPRNGGDVAAAKLRAEGKWPREYAIVATPSGGTHHYIYGLSAAKTKRDGIDLQAGAPDGTGRGFVFLPGTERIGKVDGVSRGYVLAVDRLDTFGMDDYSGAGFLAWVQDGNGSVTQLAGEKSFDLGGSGPTAIERFGDPVPAGSHDEEGARLAAALARLGFTRDNALAILRVRCGEFVGGDPRNPFTDRDLERWWAGAQKFAGPAFVPNDPEEVAEVVGSGLIDWHHLLGDDMAPEEWILEPLLAVGRQIVIYSPPKVGKSLLALEVAAGIARGHAVVGAGEVKARTVLYLDFENAPADIRDRALNMGLEPDDLGRLKYASFPALSKLDTPAGGAELLALAQDLGAEVVIVDTATRTIQGEENSNDTWSAWYANTGLQLKRAGIALIRLDHAGKDDTRGQRGGSSKASDVDGVWRLSAKEGDVLHLECEMSRVQVAEKTLVLHRQETPVLHHRVDAYGRSGSWTTRCDAVLATLDKLGVSPDLGIRSTMKRLQESNEKGSQAVVTQVQRVRKARAEGVGMGAGIPPTKLQVSPYRSAGSLVKDPGVGSTAVRGAGTMINKETGEIL